MVRRPRVETVWAAVSRVLPEIEEEFRKLGRPARSLSIYDRKSIRRLLNTRPELREPEAAERLAWAVAALLGRTGAETRAVRTQFAKSYRPPAPPLPWRMASGVGAGLILALFVLWGSSRDCGSVVAVQNDAGTTTSSVVTASVAGGVRLEVVRPEELLPGETSTHRRPREIEDILAIVFGGLLVMGGFMLFGLRRKRIDVEGRPLPPEPDVQPGLTDEDAEKRYRDVRKEYDKKILNTYHPARRVVARVSSFDTGAVVESAGILGSLSHPTPGDALDPEASARATADAAGRFTPVVQMRRRREALVVLVDVEKRDHVWLGAIRRLLLDWARLGVALEIFEFEYAPRKLVAAGTSGPARRRDLKAVMRSHPDAPVLVISRTLGRDAGDFARPDWLPPLLEAPAVAWLDPEPRRPELGRDKELRALAADGLPRFPFTERGLVAVARYLVSGGQSAERPPRPDLPDPEDPKLQETLWRWALASVLVPDATWDDVETVRRHPAIAERFPTRAHVDVLIRWVERKTGRPNGGEGPGLVVLQATLDAWIEKRRNDDPEWENEWRRTWTEELQEALRAEEDTLEKLRLQLRIARHRVFLGELGLEALDGYRGTLVHREAIRDRKQIEALRTVSTPRPAVQPPKPEEEIAHRWALSKTMVGVGFAAAVIAGWVNDRLLDVYTYTVPSRQVMMPAEFRVEKDPDLPATAARPKMVAIPPGTFWMGSPLDEKFRDDDEVRHRVKIRRGFWMAETEVTQAQWTAVMGKNPSEAKGDDLPVEMVSWFDAVAYLNRLSAREGIDPCYRLACKGDPSGGCPSGRSFCPGDHDCTRVELVGPDCPGYRLPTEAEWEYAARAGTTGPTYGPLDDIAWYYGNSNQTHPVAKTSSNAFGLYDMIGNVWEWVHNDYSDYPADTAATRVDALGPVNAGRFAVARGCGFNDGAVNCRAANRDRVGRGYRFLNGGFRPSRSRSLDP